MLEEAAMRIGFVGLIRHCMLAALARGYGEFDWSAFARIVAEEAGR